MRGLLIFNAYLKYIHMAFSKHYEPDTGGSGAARPFKYVNVARRW